MQYWEQTSYPTDVSLSVEIATKLGYNMENYGGRWAAAMEMSDRVRSPYWEIEKWLRKKKFCKPRAMQFKLLRDLATEIGIVV